MHATLTGSITKNFILFLSFSNILFKRHDEQLLIYFIIILQQFFIRVADYFYFAAALTEGAVILSYTFLFTFLFSLCVGQSGMTHPSHGILAKPISRNMGDLGISEQEDIAQMYFDAGNQAANNSPADLLKQVLSNISPVH